ncbi:hypothetical protein TIFTF001_013905 [Ficus carica]|uniref:Sox C-terminal domain-containing protein n=1 Tax=Ficus carica TaxID=3494 RepID=A0AA88A1T4_FICCA|nr:hypothetical protein TIFTF001_013905 [Ficus carica]
MSENLCTKIFPTPVSQWLHPRAPVQASKSSCQPIPRDPSPGVNPAASPAPAQHVKSASSAPSSCNSSTRPNACFEPKLQPSCQTNPASPPPRAQPA